MAYCNYYQAQVDRAKTLYVVAILRSLDHMVFDRTLNVEESIFEFFVPQDKKEQFLEIMRYFQDQKLVSNLKELPNRLITEALY